jgi:hypothetical protein
LSGAGVIENRRDRDEHVGVIRLNQMRSAV